MVVKKQISGCGQLGLLSDVSVYAPKVLVCICHCCHAWLHWHELTFLSQNEITIDETRRAIRVKCRSTSHLRLISYSAITLEHARERVVLTCAQRKSGLFLRHRAPLDDPFQQISSIISTATFNMCFVSVNQITCALGVSSKSYTPPKISLSHILLPGLIKTNNPDFFLAYWDLNSYVSFLWNSLLHFWHKKRVTRAQFIWRIFEAYLDAVVWHLTPSLKWHSILWK